MRKYLSLILCVVAVISVMTVFPTPVFAAEDEIVLPEFDYPTMSYKTFAETGIPYDELNDLFPEVLEVKHENGTLYVKDLGGNNAWYTDHLNYDGHDGELVDGYWEFAVSSEAYSAGGSISMYTDNHAWHVQYDASGERGVVSFSANVDGNHRGVMLYPTEGYGEQYVQVIYELRYGVTVSDTYEAGCLTDQMVEIQDSTSAFWARYDGQGNLQYVDISLFDTEEDATFVPGVGWTEGDWENTPADAPTGYENATMESLMAMGPADIGCAHQWSDPLCDVPSICELCHREKGAPIGHSWVSGSEYDTCSTCNGILYRIPGIEMPAFEGKPCLNLEQAGIDIDAIISKLPPQISTKYENGIFMVPNIDEYYLDARVTTKGYVSHVTEKGWNRMEVAEEDLEALILSFSKGEEHGDSEIWYDVSYDADGSLVSASIYDYESGKAIRVEFDENTVELSYPKDKDTEVEYTDVYENGDLTSQYLYDMSNGIWVYYDSDLKLEKVTVRDKGEYVSLIPGKGWTVDDNDDETVPAPEKYADKDAAYFAAAYPHNIDFCIHSFEVSEDGSVKTCVKCGEIVELDSGSDLAIIVIALVCVAVVAGVIIVVSKKKKQKAE